MADVAIVTGGTGSIGRAVCDVLAAEGWTCIAGDLVEPEAADKPGIHFHRLDVGNAESIAGLLDRARALGTVRALVAAHGILGRGRFRSIPFSDVANVTSDIGATQSQTVAQTARAWWNIRAARKAGGDFVIARNLRSRREAQWLAAEIRRRMGGT